MKFEANNRTLIAIVLFFMSYDDNGLAILAEVAEELRAEGLL